MDPRSILSNSARMLARAGTSSRIGMVAESSRAGVAITRRYNSSTAPSSSASTSTLPSTSASSLPPQSPIPSSNQPPALHPRTHNIHVASLHLYAHTPGPLERFCNFALHSAYSLNMPVTRPARLPTVKSLFTVTKSPFVHKKAQENFERRVHKRVINVYDTHREIVDTWLRYLANNGVAGVGIKARVHEWAELGVGKKEMDGVLRKFGSGVGSEGVMKEVEGIRRDLGEEVKADLEKEKA